MLLPDGAPEGCQGFADQQSCPEMLASLARAHSGACHALPLSVPIAFQESFGCAPACGHSPLLHATLYYLE